MSDARQRLRLEMLRLFAALHQPTTRPDTGCSILLLRPDHLGDLLFSTPALRLLRRELPQARLTMMVGPWGRQVMAHSPYLDELLVCEFPGFTRKPKPSPLQPYIYLWRQARLISRLGFNLSAILRFDHWWGGLLAYLAGIPRRIGYGLPETTPFLTTSLPYRGDQHEVRQNLELARAISAALGGSPAQETEEPAYTSNPLEFCPTPEEEDWADRFLEGHGLAGTSPIAIHPGAGAAVKLWQAEGWGRVAGALSGRRHTAVVLTGSPQEVELCRQVASAARCPTIMAAGMTTLGQLGALYRRCALVLGPDSGPLHLAVAVGSPTIHLFGPADRRKFGPWGDPTRHRVLTAGLACIPCNRLDYRPGELAAHPCVRLIEAGQVIATAEEILGRGNI